MPRKRLPIDERSPARAHAGMPGAALFLPAATVAPHPATGSASHPSPVGEGLKLGAYDASHVRISCRETLQATCGP